MFSATFNLTGKRKLILLAAVLTVVLISISFIMVLPESGNADTPEKRNNILSSLGISLPDVEEDKTTVVLPSAESESFKAYNAIMNEGGYDLRGYIGKTVDRYSYDSEKLSVSLLVYRGQLIGGEIYDKDSCRYKPLAALSGDEYGNSEN